MEKRTKKVNANNTVLFAMQCMLIMKLPTSESRIPEMLLDCRHLFRVTLRAAGSRQQATTCTVLREVTGINIENF